MNVGTRRAVSANNKTVTNHKFTPLGAGLTASPHRLSVNHVVLDGVSSMSQPKVGVR